MKKLLMLVIALMLVTCMFVACGGGNGDGNDNGTSDGSNNNTGNGNGNDGPCTHATLVVNPKKPGTPSTCVAKGVSPEMLCADCGVVVQESTKLNNYGDHPAESIVPIEAKAPTCTTAGNTAGTLCSLCSSPVDKPTSIPKSDHIPTDTAYVAPTATQAGHKGGTHCSECFGTLTNPEVIAAHGHDIGLEHIEVRSEAVAPTCTDAGARAEIYCSICDVVFQEASEIPALNHPASSCVVTLAAITPTCQNAGRTATIHCELCNSDVQVSEEIPADPNCHLAQHWEIIPAVAPKCYEDGLLAGVKCSACDAVIVAQAADTVRPDHKFDELVSEYDAADCTLWETPEDANGKTALRKCVVDGCTATIGGEIVPFVHVMVDDPESYIAPNCITETNGKTAGQKCSVNGCTYKEPGETIYWEHTPGEWIIDTPATETTDGHRHTTCTVEGCGDRIDDDFVYVPEEDEIIE